MKDELVTFYLNNKEERGSLLLGCKNAHSLHLIVILIRSAIFHRHFTLKYICMPIPFLSLTKHPITLILKQLLWLMSIIAHGFSFFSWSLILFNKSANTAIARFSESTFTPINKSVNLDALFLLKRLALSFWNFEHQSKRKTNQHQLLRKFHLRKECFHERNTLNIGLVSWSFSLHAVGNAI